MIFSTFENYGALNSAPVFQAFAQGLDNLGLVRRSHDMAADVAVIWSLVWNGRMQSNQEVWQQFRSSGRPVIVLEVGALRRGETWKMAINGTGRDAFWGHGLDLSRPAKLDLQLKPWREQGDHVLIACQRSDSEQWSGMPPTTQWLTQVRDLLRQHTDRELRVRLHPRQSVTVPHGMTRDQPRALAGTYDDFDFDRSLEQAWCVVNWNSGMACQAVINGIPALTGATNLAAPVATLDWTKVETPEMPDRSRWLLNLCHTEWTVEEIASGYPLSRLMSGLETL